MFASTLSWLLMLLLHLPIINYFGATKGMITRDPGFSHIPDLKSTLKSFKKIIWASHQQHFKSFQSWRPETGTRTDLTRVPVHFGFFLLINNVAVHCLLLFFFFFKDATQGVTSHFPSRRKAQRTAVTSSPSSPCPHRGGKMVAADAIKPAPGRGFSAA